MRSEKFIKANEVELCTEAFGNKNDPSILLIAGATVSMLYWEKDFCKRLASHGFYVIRYDSRDVGKSTCYEAGSTPYTILDLTNDALAILNAYGIEKAHFAGMSLGGLISQIAAIKFPERVISLILIATGPWGDSDPSIPEMDNRILEFHAKSGSIDWTNETDVVHYLVKGAELMSGKKRCDKLRLESRIRAEFRRANNYISMFNHASLKGGEEYYNRLEEIKQPTLIIHGTDDVVWHFRHSNVLTDKIENSYLLKLEETGHELCFEDWPIIIEGISRHKGMCNLY